MSSLRIFQVGITIILISLTAICSARNLVTNPGFEEDVDPNNGVPDTWTDQWASIPTKSMDSSIKHSGNYSWKFQNNGTKYSGAYSDFIAVDPNNYYDVSVWIKSELGTESVSVGWEEYDSNFQSFSWDGISYFVLSNKTVSTNWAFYQKYKRPLNEHARYVRLRFFGPYETEGTIWWDDFSLSICNPSTELKNPGFEEVSGGHPHYWTDQWASVSKVLESDPNHVHSGTYSWRFINDGTKYSGAYSDFIKVDTGQYYYYSAWIECALGTETIGCHWEEFDANFNTVKKYASIYRTDGNNATNPYRPLEWTKFEGILLIQDPQTQYIRLRIFGPYETTGIVWWDDFEVCKVGYQYSAILGKSPNYTIDFGADTEVDPNGGIGSNYLSVMGSKMIDSNVPNLNYRSQLINKAMYIDFPAFNIDPNSDLLLSPIMLEIHYKDVNDDKTDEVSALATNLAVVSSWIGYSSIPDDFYKITDLNREYNIGRLGGEGDSVWKIFQYVFQPSPYQLLRVTNGNFRIYIRTKSGLYNEIPIDYITLKSITEEQYADFYEQQKEMKGFWKVIVEDEPSGPASYSDPNLMVFSRDPMHPIYPHTQPKLDELTDTISGFGCWSDIEPLTFGLYSENGINNVSVEVSDLVHQIFPNNIISRDTIEVTKVVATETRLGYTTSLYYINRNSYAVQPDYLLPFNSLDIPAGTSQAIWLKINIPESSMQLKAGVYSGTVTLRQGQAIRSVLNLDFTIYDITLDPPAYYNRLADPISRLYIEDVNAILEDYRRTGMESMIHAIQYRIIPNEINGQIQYDGQGNMLFETEEFEKYLDKFIESGVAADRMFCHVLYMGTQDILEVTGGSLSTSNSDLYADLSDAEFVKQYKNLIYEYNRITAEKGVTLVYRVHDEPGVDPYRRILCDRLYPLIREAGGLTWVTYYTACDEPVDMSNSYYTLPEGVDTLDPITDLIDYKCWALRYAYSGYKRHFDPTDPDYYGSNDTSKFCYYTTGHSHWRNPIYNRFLHGLFAYASNSAMVGSYTIGDYINDPFNDFDASYLYTRTFTYPDFLYAYPSWERKLIYTIGGLEAIREGIKDGKYIATLKALIVQDPNNPIAVEASDYLTSVKGRISPNFQDDYYQNEETTVYGYYPLILRDLSETNGEDDFEAFTKIRKKIADYILALTHGVYNSTDDMWYSSIQEAIDEAADGDELVVYPGTYYEQLDFGYKNLILRSVDPNDRDIVAATVIDGTDLENPDCTVYIAHSQDRSTQVRGLTITGNDDGIYIARDAGPVIERCIIAYNGNHGIWVNNYELDARSPLIRNNLIYDNGNYGIKSGNDTAYSEILNNLIYDCVRGIFLDGVGGLLANNTILNNNYGIYVGSDLGMIVTVSNCILWGNGDDLYCANVQVTPTYCCIEDGDAGAGNIHTDPNFADAVNYDFHLTLLSPCIDTGDPNGVYTGQTDIDGEDRVMDGDGDQTADVDMGADEYNPD